MPAKFELCQNIIAPGGAIANVGVHGKKVDLHLEKLWDRNITITTRLVDTASSPTLLDIVGAKKLDPRELITNRFASPKQPAAVVARSKVQSSSMSASMGVAPAGMRVR